MDNKSKKKKIDRLTKADIGTHVIKIEELEKLIDYTEVDNSDNSIDVSMCWGFCVSCSAQCENDASD